MKFEWGKIKKIGIVMGIIVSTIIILNYFCPYICGYKEKEFLTKQDCKRIGEEAYQKDKNKFKDYQMCEPEYTYNKELNTCLYYSCYTKTEATIEGVTLKTTKKWVKNSLTNEEIISYPSANPEIITPDFLLSDLIIPGVAFEEIPLSTSALEAISLSPSTFQIVPTYYMEFRNKDLENFEKSKKGLFDQ